MIESNENGTICENMAPDSIERQWSLIRETQMRTVRCHVSFNGSTIAQSQQCFFSSKIVFIFRVSSVLFSLEFSWLPSQKHIASQRIIDVWAKYNGKGVDRLVISCFIDNSSYIAMMYVCIDGSPMQWWCSDNHQQSTEFCIQFSQISKSSFNASSHEEYVLTLLFSFRFTSIGRVQWS